MAIYRKEFSRWQVRLANVITWLEQLQEAIMAARFMAASIKARKEVEAEIAARKKRQDAELELQLSSMWPHRNK